MVIITNQATTFIIPLFGNNMKLNYYIKNKRHIQPIHTCHQEEYSEDLNISVFKILLGNIVLLGKVVSTQCHNTKIETKSCSVYYFLQFFLQVEINDQELIKK